MAAVVSKNNSLEYADKCYDGGIWYKISGNQVSVIDITPKALELFGYSSIDEMNSQEGQLSSAMSLIASDEKEAEDVNSFLIHQNDYFSAEFVINNRKNGKHQFVGVHGSESFLHECEEGERVVKIWLVKLDVKDMIFRRAEKMLDSINSGILLLTESDQDGYQIFGCNDILSNYINDRIRRLSGEEPLTKDDFCGMDVGRLIAISQTVDEPVVRQMIIDAKLRGHSQCVLEIQAGSKQLWISAKALVKKLTSGLNLITIVCGDITKMIEAERELKAKHADLINLYYHDSLTGVLNRKSYNDFVTHIQGRSIENIGVAYVDINALKEINETLGHGEGDKTIEKLTHIMLNYFDDDEIYRISGDEFVVISRNVRREFFETSISDLTLELNRNGIASIGSIWAAVCEDIEKQVGIAEELMRIAKRSFYASHEESILLHRPEILEKLISDIDAGKFQLYLQPKAEIGSTRVTGAEALVRKINDDGTVVPPINFVPILEKERLVSRIDFFMLEEVCKLLEDWKRKFLRPIKVSVNMSRITLAEPDYISKLLEIVRKYDVEPSKIELEITESTETIDPDKFRAVISEVKRLGFGVALDDMGSDYSTVRMLEINEIDTVKFDRSIVLKMDTQEGEIMIHHLINLCHALGKTCLAEGVESNQMREKLAEMAFDQYQGYLLARPVPVMEFEKLM